MGRKMRLCQTSKCDDIAKLVSQGSDSCDSHVMMSIKLAIQENEDTNIKVRGYHHLTDLLSTNNSCLLHASFVVVPAGLCTHIQQLFFILNTSGYNE